MCHPFRMVTAVVITIMVVKVAFMLTLVRIACSITPTHLYPSEVWEEIEEEEGTATGTVDSRTIAVLHATAKVRACTVLRVNKTTERLSMEATVVLAAAANRAERRMSTEQLTSIQTQALIRVRAMVVLVPV